MCKPLLVVLGTLLAFGQPPEKLAAAEGIVLDDSGRPLADATVFALPQRDMRSQLRTMTDREGRFHLERIPAGHLYLDAYKESDGFPYSFFAFFKTIDGLPIEIDAKEGITANVVIRLGPKAAVLKLEAVDQSGQTVTRDATLKFTRPDMPTRGDYSVGAMLPSASLVPPVPFRLTVEVEGYQAWHSELTVPRSGETIDLHAQLRQK